MGDISGKLGLAYAVFQVTWAYEVFARFVVFGLLYNL